MHKPVFELTVSSVWLLHLQTSISHLIKKKKKEKISLKRSLHELLMQADGTQRAEENSCSIFSRNNSKSPDRDKHSARPLHPAIMKYSASALLLLLLCPHGNNNQASDARALGACWGIICTSAWIPPNSVYWMTGGGHRSAKRRDFQSSTRWKGTEVLTPQLYVEIDVREFSCTSQTW